MKLKFQLPWPNPALNQNRTTGKHWGRTSALRKKAKSDGFTLARAADPGQQFYGILGDIAVTLTFFVPDERRRDQDNLLSACKQNLDGIALAIGVDDSQFEPVTLKRGYDVNKNGFVLVELEVKT